MNVVTRFLNQLPAPEKAVVVALFVAFGLGVLDQVLGTVAAARSDITKFDWRLLAHNLTTFWGGAYLGLLVLAGAQFFAIAGFGSVGAAIGGGGFSAAYAAFLVQTRADLWSKVTLILGSHPAPLGLTVSAAQAVLATTTLGAALGAPGATVPHPLGAQIVPRDGPTVTPAPSVGP